MGTIVKEESTMKKINSEEKFLIRIIIFVAVALMFVGYGKYMDKVVREETIKSAELIEVTDDGYIISFDGEEHIYDYED